MKKAIFILLIAILSCKGKKDNDVNANSNCSATSSYNDTLIIGNYKLWLITLIDKSSGSLEVIDNNNNNIDGSGDFSISLIQLQNGNNCWETNSIGKSTGSSSNSYDGLFGGIPAWAGDSKTKATIKITISGKDYYLRDEQVNN